MSNLLKISTFDSSMFKSQSEGALFVIIIKIVIFRYSDRCDLQRDKNTDTRKQTDNEEERVLKRDTCYQDILIFIVLVIIRLLRIIVVSICCFIRISRLRLGVLGQVASDTGYTTDSGAGATYSGV